MNDLGHWIFLGVYTVLIGTHVGAWLYIQARKFIRKTHG